MPTARRTAPALAMTAAALFAPGQEAMGSGPGTPPSFGPYSWVEGSKIGVLTDNPESYPAIFVNSTKAETTPPAGEWIPLKVTQFGIPADAKAVFIGGILIITHGKKTQLCDIRQAGDHDGPQQLHFPGNRAANRRGAAGDGRRLGARRRWGHRLAMGPRRREDAISQRRDRPLPGRMLLRDQSLSAGLYPLSISSQRGRCTRARRPP